jgi:phosphoribosylaminoimidazolecarboxamide formyltransferase / IMP cyclohydrolase
MSKIERALISVSDKKGIVELAKELASFNIEILSTGGTARQMREAGLNVMDVSDYTGFPEMMNGRVKTLHPMIHGGLLGLRNNPEHVEVMGKHGIKKIDMVVVNLYPFKETVAKPDVTLEDAIENIDIGGPSMLRSASKNFESVTVLTEPEDYSAVIEEMKKSGGSVSRETNFRLAVKVYKKTSEYDRMITEYLTEVLNSK